ncbi:MAG: hypothetical protein FWH42_04425 [Dehalococcoidia bacterium]|nr:hypothetical protein [Dehalococcoidia bacterium]
MKASKQLSAFFRPLFIGLIYLSLTSSCMLLLDSNVYATDKQPSKPGRNPQYLVMHKLGWDAKAPKSYNQASMDEILNALGTKGNENRRLAVASTIPYFAFPVDQIIASIKNMMKLSEDNDIPIVIHLDGVNAWHNTGLWNWFDSSRHDFNPANINNVERFDWGTDDKTAVKVGWRNWGGQIRVDPQPNLASPVFRELNAKRLRQILPTIALWYNTLPSDKKHLFGGVVLGQEVSPYWSAFYYTNGNDYWEWNRSLPNAQDVIRKEDTKNGFVSGPVKNTKPLGYAAAQTLAQRGVNIQTKGPISAETIGIIINDYLEYLIDVSIRYIQPDKIITHAFFGPYHPLGAGISKVDGVMPGWTTFPRLYQDIKVDEKSSSPYSGIPWAAVEFPAEVAITADVLEGIFNHGNCRQVNVKHWERVLANQDYLNAIKAVLGKSNNPSNQTSESKKP